VADTESDAIQRDVVAVKGACVLDLLSMDLRVRWCEMCKKVRITPFLYNRKNRRRCQNLKKMRGEILPRHSVRAFWCMYRHFIEDILWIAAWVEPPPEASTAVVTESIDCLPRSER
jgi:hypothetical protein